TSHVMITDVPRGVGVPTPQALRSTVRSRGAGSSPDARPAHLLRSLRSGGLGAAAAGTDPDSLAPRGGRRTSVPRRVVGACPAVRAEGARLAARPDAGAGR